MEPTGGAIGEWMDEQDVEPARRTGRRRPLLVLGAAVAVLALVGVGGVHLLRNDPGGPPPPAPSEAPGVSVPYDAPGAARTTVAPDTPYMAVPPGTNPPDVRPTAAPVVAAPLGPATGDCADGQDPALRDLVDEALPETVGAPEAPATLECRPGGRIVVLEVPGGLLSVAYLPPGQVPVPFAGSRTAPTASGGSVVVESRPDVAEAPAPFADRLDATVAYLAPRL